MAAKQGDLVARLVGDRYVENARAPGEGAFLRFRDQLVAVSSTGNERNLGDMRDAYLVVRVAGIGKGRVRQREGEPTVAEY